MIDRLLRNHGDTYRSATICRIIIIGHTPNEKNSTNHRNNENQRLKKTLSLVQNTNLATLAILLIDTKA